MDIIDKNQPPPREHVRHHQGPIAYFFFFFLSFHVFSFLFSFFNDDNDGVMCWKLSLLNSSQAQQGRHNEWKSLNQGRTLDILVA